MCCAKLFPRDMFTSHLFVPFHAPYPTQGRGILEQLQPTLKDESLLSFIAVIEVFINLQTTTSPLNISSTRVRVQSGYGGTCDQ